MPVSGKTGAQSYFAALRSIKPQQVDKPQGDEEESEEDVAEEDHSDVNVRKRKRRRIRRKQFNYEKIPGVVKVTLSTLSQKIVGCVVGEDVTGEKSWKIVRKDDIIDNLELHEDSSEFLPIKASLKKYQKQDVLIGYVPSEVSPVDYFYICVTKEAFDKVTKIIETQQKHQERRLYNTVYKKVHKYRSKTSQQTDEEVKQQMNISNRPLYKIKLVTDYPIMKEIVEFRCRMAENGRHEYTEMIDTRFVYNNVHKVRIDRSVQQTPSYNTNTTQTFCTYPKNVWTQYSYTYQTDEESLVKIYKELDKYLKRNMDQIWDLLRVNGHINLYKEEYLCLVVDKSTTKPKLLKFTKDYTCLYDLRYCRDRMISSVCWHPFWTGTVAVAYAQVSPFSYLSAANKSFAVDDWNSRKPVLLWSFKDTLYPKLLLKAPREVKRLSFCPYDPNLLAGGCKNGQVIVWDLTRKLEMVESRETLSEAQKKHRIRLKTKMKWMKNIKDLTMVKYAVISDLEHSHFSPVTSILWLPCNSEITKTGQLRAIPKNQNRQSKIFVTCSRDGTILFWDLLTKPPRLQQGGLYRRRKELKRLPEYPKALISDVSRYSHLNRIFKPIYKLNVVIPENPTKNFCLTCLHMNEPLVKLKPVGKPPKVFNITDRLIHEVDSIEDQEVKSEFVAGTLRGRFLVGKWEGYAFNSGEKVNFEDTKLLNIGCYHDGPVVTLCGCRIKDYVLSIGGSIFCIWNTSFLHKPIFWKKTDCHYTNGNWNLFRPAMFKLVRSDGKMEMWNLTCQGNTYSVIQSITSNPLTNCRTHPVMARQNTMAVADSTGALRILYVPRSLITYKENELDLLKEFLDRETERKALYQNWQKEWTKKHAKVKAEKGEEFKRPTVEPSVVIEKPKEPPKQAKKEKPPPGQHHRDLEEKWKERERERMRRVLLGKKHLNKKQLEKQQAPLKKMEHLEMQKKKRQEEILKKSEEMFAESVAILFPEVIKEKPQLQQDPYEYEHSREDLRECLSQYDDMEKDITDYIEEHPFELNFTWRKFYTMGKFRRKNLDPERKAVAYRQRRYGSYKFRRNQEEENKDGEGPPIVRLTSSEIIARSLFEYEYYVEDLEENNLSNITLGRENKLSFC